MRFTVGSVTGYPVSAKADIRARHWAATWYVYDSAYCYRIVQTFHGASAEMRALKMAEKLNAGGSAEPSQVAGDKCKNGHELKPHNFYVNKRGHCICRICTYDANLRRQKRLRDAA